MIVGLSVWHNGELFHCFCYVSTYILLLHIIIILHFHLPYFHVSHSALLLDITLVISSCIDLIATLSIWDGSETYWQDELTKHNYLRVTVYPKKYAHGFVVLCFVVVMESFIMNSHKVFIHIHQGCFAGTGAIVRLPQCQWSKPDGYGKFSQCITTTKHSKAKTMCIFLGIYCT